MTETETLDSDLARYAERVKSSLRAIPVLNRRSPFLIHAVLVWDPGDGRLAESATVCGITRGSRWLPVSERVAREEIEKNPARACARCGLALAEATKRRSAWIDEIVETSLRKVRGEA